MENNWEIVKVLSTAIGVIAIPIVLAVIGNQFNKSLKEREVQGKFVELAVRILEAEPTADNVQIREWATKIIDNYSGVKLSESTRKDLIERTPLVDPKIQQTYGDIEIPVTDYNDLRINNHFLLGKGTTYAISINTSGQILDGDVKAIVLHYTASASAEQTKKFLTNPNTKASAHLIIDRDGSVYQLIPFNYISWGTGRSEYKGLVGFNKFSISIELVNAGKVEKQGDNFITWYGQTLDASEVIKARHKHQTEEMYWQTYTDIQIKRANEICKLLVDEYDIPWILGHEDVAQGRKLEPGPAFPMSQLQKEILGTVLE